MYEALLVTSAACYIGLKQIAQMTAFVGKEITGLSSKAALSLSPPKYRADVDGLRAVAVLCVLGFHGFPEWVRGGFIGVDVFFVISGFLITTIIVGNLQKGTFSFREFYARRVKRIFPALVAVLVACYVFGWFTLLPNEFEQLAKHIASGAAFVANVTLWKEVGYFDNSAETKPLLHLWSLGIEEQFYLVWPLLLWCAWRKKFNLFLVMLLVLLGSFYLNLAWTKTDITAAFYAPVTRFWELACGGALALLMLQGRPAMQELRLTLDHLLAWRIYRKQEQPTGYALANAFSAAGVAALTFGLYKINAGSIFPGVWAAFPVLGAMLLILAGPTGWVNRTILSHPLAVWFGTISYPLYLWHWPLLAFARIVQGEGAGVPIRVTALAVSVLLAWLTYVVIEKPVRFGKPTGLKVAVPAILMAGLAGVGLATYEGNGWVSRFRLLSPENYSKIAVLANAWQVRPRPEGVQEERGSGLSRLSGKDGRKLLFVGDSHMLQYRANFSALYKSNAVALNSRPTIVFRSTSFPPPIEADLLTDPSVRTVVFSYFWSYRYGSDKVHQPSRCCGNGKNGTFGTYGLPLASPEQMTKLDAEWISILASLRKSGKQVYVVLDNPFGEEVAPHFMFERSWRGLTFLTPNPLSRATAIERAEPVRSRLLRIAEQTQVTVIDPFVYLCPDGYCPAFSPEGELLYSDYDHLSYFAMINKIGYLNELVGR